jgi:drug/metabolite transporter (DMT)-like permease
MSDELQARAQAEKKARVNWGFRWAIICALLWGMGYVAMTALWDCDPFVSPENFSGMKAYIISAILMSALQATVFAIVLCLFWALLTGKLKEVGKTLAHPKISKWLTAAALFGGPCAIFGSTLAIGYVGAAFASAIGLLSAVVGTILGWAVYKEKITRKTAAGVIMLVVGGVLVLDPANMIDTIQDPASPDGVWLGYVGGLMSALGWGIEGAFAARALDVTDPDSSVCVRYVCESLLWLIILLPVTAVIVGPGDFYDMFVDAVTNPDFIFWEVIASFTLGMCYVTMYKCYPLIGVGRTLSLTAMYVPVSIVALYAFMGQVPSWWIVIGTIISVAGMFVMYWESDTISGSTRNTEEA